MNKELIPTEKTGTTNPKRTRPAVIRIAGEKRIASEQEKKFVREYLKCFNMVQAARNAGYGHSYAVKKSYQIFGRPWVQEYFEQLRKEYELDDIASIKEVVMNYTKQMRGELKEKKKYRKYVYVVDKATGKRSKKYVEGYELEETIIASGSQNMGKYHKLFAETAVTVSVAPTIVADIPKEMPTDDGLPNEIPTFEEALKQLEKFDDLKEDKPDGTTECNKAD